MNFEKSLYEKNISLNNQKSYFKNYNYHCNCCSCFCSHCCCCCQCQCHQESKRIEKENNNKSYENYYLKTNNRNYSLPTTKYFKNSSLENLHLKNSFNDNNNNKLNVSNSLNYIPIKRNTEINNLNQELLSYEDKKNNYPSTLKSAPNNSTYKRINNTTKLIKNNYKDDREKAKMEFVNLLNSIQDSDNTDNLNDENNKVLKTHFFPKQKTQIDNYQKNIKNIKTIYSYNGNRIKDENIKKNKLNNFQFLSENNNIKYSNPFSKKINNNKSEKMNNIIKPNKKNNIILYKNIPKNPRNKIETNYYNSYIQKFSFQFIHKDDKINNMQKLKEENQKLKNDISKKNKRNVSLNQQVLNLQNDLNDLLNENNNLQQLFKKFDKNTTSNNNQNKNLKKEINYYKNQLSNLAKENSELVNNLENIQSDFINLENENNILSIEKKNLQNENKKLKNQMNNCKKQIENKDNLYLENNFIPNQEMNNLLKKKNKKIENNPKELEIENQNLINLVLEYKKNISSLIEENEILKNQHLNDQQNLEELIEENKGLNNQNLINQKEILSLKQENKNLINQINSLQSESSILESIEKTKFINKNPYKLFKDLSIKTGSRINYKGNSPISNNNTNSNINYLNDSYKKVTTSTTTSKHIINSSNSSISKLMNKFKIENNLNISPIKKIKKKFITNIDNLGDNLVFKLYLGKNILCYDFTNNNFGLFDFADYNNFENNLITEENNGNIFLSYNSILYIVTGKNSDFFYEFNPKKKSMEKLCSLNNNHSKGSLIAFQNSIICLSGEHNKKCEIYSIHKNEWNELPEMNFERSDFGACIIKNKYLFSIFGFNSPKNEYLNNIEYLDLLSEGSLWKNLDYKSDNFSLYIKGLLTLNYFDNKIILIGGFNGEFNKPVETFAQIILGDDFEKEIYVENVDRKLKDIQKYKSYIFCNGVTERKDEKGRIYNITFDNDDRIHIFEMQNMGHDVYSFE